MSGKKFDKNKPQVHLMTKDAIFEISDALAFGAKKYGKYNFYGGIEYTRLVDAAIRHLLKFIDGEDLDDESGLNHIAHAGANIAMLLFMIKNRPEFDDRPKNKKKKKKK